MVLWPAPQLSSSQIIAASSCPYIESISGLFCAFGEIVRLQAPDLALVLSLPEGCPFSDPSSLYGLQLDGCTWSRWIVMEAVISSTNH